jgi:hypothetical protein
MLTHYDLDINPPRNSSARGRGVEVSNNNRCPCCDSPKWCFILDDGDAVICGRTDIAPEGWERAGTAKKDGRAIFVKVGKRVHDRRYRGVLPEAATIRLETHPLADFPQWVEIGSDHQGIKELQIEFLYPDAETGEPLGKVVRRQYDDRRCAYNDGKDTKHLRPQHWHFNDHPSVMQAFWTDRGKGLKRWSLYREAEVRDAIASGECNILFSGTGEQAVESFRHLGLYSICAAGGEGTGDAQVIDFLKRNTPQVFVIPPDEDKTGHKAAAKLQEKCNTVRLPAVTINLRNIWPNLPPKGDITNVLSESGMSKPEIVKRLEAEIRRVIAARLEHERKANDPDERLKLDLQALLQESDPIKRMRRRAEIASHYRLSKAEIEEALNELKQRHTTPETQWFNLDDFFDLESEGLKWLIPELLPAGETVILAGSPKSGKTLLAIDAAFAVATGESTFLKETVTQGRVLVISVDESAHSTKAKLLKRGFRRSDAQNVQLITKFDIRQIRVLEERLETFRPHLVIIDSLKRIVHGQEVSENSAEFADNIYSLKEMLTRYGAAGILIHHTSKNPEAMGVGKLRGSSAIAGAVWGTWQLDHIPKPDPHNKKKLIIDPKDARRILSVFARDTEGQQLRIELDLENNSWLNLGGVDDSENTEQERTTLKNRIINILSHNAHKPGLPGREIIELLGMTPEEGRSIYTTLNRMVGQRLVSCRPAPGDKRYNLYSLPNQSLDINQHVVEDTPSPTPRIQNVDCLAETYTQQEFPIFNKLLNNYSTNSQHVAEDTPPVDYSNPGIEGISEILNNSQLKEGGGGGETQPVQSPHHYPACTCPPCLLVEEELEISAIAQSRMQLSPTEPQHQPAAATESPVPSPRDLAAQILQYQSWVAAVEAMDAVSAAIDRNRVVVFKSILNHLSIDDRQHLVQLLAAHMQQFSDDHGAYNWLPESLRKLKEKAITLVIAATVTA